MTVTTAREYVRYSARNAADSTQYSDADVDRVILMLQERFIRKTGSCLLRQNEVALTDGTSTASGFPAGFRPDRLRSCWLEDSDGLPQEPLTVIGTAELVERKRQFGTGEGVPTHLAFKSLSPLDIEADLWLTPSAAYTLKFEWLALPVTWTEGSSSYTDTNRTLSIPDDLIRPVLYYGAAAALQHNQPEHGYAGEAWKKYLEYEAECMGLNTMGAKVLTARKDDPRPRRKMVNFALE